MLAERRARASRAIVLIGLIITNTLRDVKDSAIGFTGVVPHV